MHTTILKKWKLGLVSLSALAIMAACGNDNDPLPDTETPDTTEEPTEAPADSENGADEQTDDQTNEESTTDPSDTTGTEDTATQTASEGLLSMTFQISLEDAVKTFHDTFGENVNIEEVEFDENNGEFYYKIDGWEAQTEYELDIHANTGEIHKENTEDNEDPDGDILEIENYISPEEAMQAAVDASSTDFVEEWTLEIEDGRPVYDINLDGDNDVEVDAETGEIR